MERILIFAGTIEGRKLTEYLAKNNVCVYVSVATEYGETLIEEKENIHVSAKRMTTEDMELYIKDNKINYVVDATHPYAVEVTENIKSACEKTAVEYLRLIRKSDDTDSNFLVVESVEEAAEYLCNTSGNILLTTGSKELAKYTIIPDYKERVFARVLSTANVAAECAKLGFEGKNLICMQGPFSEELNYAMLKQIDAKYLVTKDTGKQGGFEEKINAAARAGVKVILVSRKCKEEGMNYFEIISYLCKKLNIKVKQNITILGIGMGTIDNMTLEAVNACKNADLLIGADRMLENLRQFGKPEFISYKANEIAEYIEAHNEFENVVVAMSGDVGFYSGTKKLLEAFNNFDVQIFPGISSVVYFCSKIKTSWDDAKLVSIHGRSENIIGEIKNNYKVFSLLGGKARVKELCELLIEYKLENVDLFIGERLSYGDEKITCGKPADLMEKEFDNLCVVVVFNEEAKNAIITHGIPDDSFIRGKVPMTKEEIRSISLSKLRLCRDSVIYDVGAGTGSVSIEMARQAIDGVVYAIERNPDGLDLIRQNQRKLGIANIECIEGLAPMAMEDLPMPTHAFIGGSAGNMKEILRSLLNKNSNIRIVINAIALETIAETVEFIKELKVKDVDIVQVSVSKSNILGKYHMMMGENPIYIISFTGGEA